MRNTAIFLLFCFLTVSFIRISEPKEKYEIDFEARGCFYQITVNEETVLEGKSYQMVHEKLDIAKSLADSGTQSIEIKMNRISREIPLKSTGAYMKVILREISEDSTRIIKEVSLPTFPYDDDEDQPYSIAGSIFFELKKEEASEENTEAPVEKPNPKEKPSDSE